MTKIEAHSEKAAHSLSSSNRLFFEGEDLQVDSLTISSHVTLRAYCLKSPVQPNLDEFCWNNAAIGRARKAWLSNFGTRRLLGLKKQMRGNQGNLLWLIWKLRESAALLSRMRNHFAFLNFSRSVSSKFLWNEIKWSGRAVTQNLAHLGKFYELARGAQSQSLVATSRCLWIEFLIVQRFSNSSPVPIYSSFSVSPPLYALP